MPEDDSGLRDEVRQALRMGADHLGLPFAIVSHVRGASYTVEHIVAPAEAGLTQGQEFALGETYCAITLEADDIVTIDEMGTSPHAGHPCYGAFALESYIGVPIRLDGAVYGTLNFSGAERRPADYGLAERGLVKLVASWVERTLERQELIARQGEASRREAIAAAQFEALFERIRDAAIVHRDGHVVEVNSRTLELLGVQEREALVGRALADFVPRPEDRVEVAARLALLASGGVPDAPSQIYVERPDGERRFVETIGVPVVRVDGPAAVTLVRDLTERRSAQLRLMQAERLASVGSLAAGVAHELNNPLAYVVANLEVASEDLAEIIGGSPSKRLRELREAIDEARQGAERARRIVRDLRTFSRVDEEARAPQDVNRLVDVAVSMTRNELRHRARIERRYGAVEPVMADEARLTQVFVNLLMNAAQAIPEGAAEEHEVRIDTQMEEGRVLVRVSDTGPGIAPHVISRIFDPFYTTKPPGEGTGLGLSLSHNIVSALGGELRASNSADGGASFEVWLPPTEDSSTEEPEVGSAGPRARRGRVLVIDDDALVARSIERVLGRLHDVTVTERGAEALEWLVQGGADFDVILCDLTMPTMPGWRVHEVLERERPDVVKRMIFITGGALGQEGQRFLDRVPNVRLDKPFDMKNLRALVAGMIERGAAAQLPLE